MNQDQVKEKLVTLKETKDDFTVIFSGKRSKKVNGLYHPEGCEIIIHNGNFSSDNSLMYTAIHEYAHHVVCSESALPVSNRSHTNLFWSTFHNLLYKAEELGIYENIFTTIDEFVDLTERIKSEYIKPNGQLIRDFGKLLLEAEELCRRYEVPFTDFLDRVICIPRDSAKSMIKTHVFNIAPELGYENMKLVASIPEPEERQKAEQAFMHGQSPDMVKQVFKPPRQSSDSELEQLQSEKRSIEQRIERLTERLKEIENRLDEAEKHDYYNLN